MGSFIPKIYKLHLLMCDEELKEKATDETGEIDLSSVLVGVLAEFKSLEYSKYSMKENSNLEKIKLLEFEEGE